jgi:hypothetical protein
MAIEEWLADRCREWSFNEGGRTQQLVVLGHKPDRWTTILFQQNARSPFAVVKVAGPLERGALEREREVLIELGRLRARGAPVQSPESLGLYVGWDHAAHALEFVSGRRPAGFFRRGSSTLSRRRVIAVVRGVAKVSSALATLDRSELPLSDIAAPLATWAKTKPSLCPQGFSTELLDQIGSSEILTATAWQHGDVNLGNLLRCGSEMRYVDWEDAAADLPVWFDLATIPFNLVRTVSNATGLPITGQLVADVLGSAGTVGAALHRAYADLWTFRVPMGWAFLLAALIESSRHDWASLDEDLAATFAACLLSAEPPRSPIDWAPVCGQR